MPKSPPSSRAANKVHLNFALPIPGTDVTMPVSVPVTLYSGVVSDHGIKRKSYVPAEDGDHPVGQQNYDKSTGEVVAYQDIVMKVETEYGPVYVEDHEIEKLFEITPDTIVIKGYQPLALFHQGHYLPTSRQDIQVRVEGTGKKKGPDLNSTKMLNTLLEALRDEGAMALVDITTRGKPKPGLITPDGYLWTLRFTEEVREQHERVEYKPSEGELMLFAEAIKQSFSTAPVDLTDERSALIQAFADEKASEGDFERPEAVEIEKKAPVEMDMMAQLMASVEAAKATKGA